MRRPSVEEGRRWLSQAERDLDAAELLGKGGHFNLACFHSQQAAEKGAKALLYARGAEDVRGHSVSRLIQDAVTFEPDVASLLRTGAALDKFYIPTRYPNGLPGGLPSDAYTEDEAEGAIAKARSSLDEIRSLVGQEPAQD